VTIDIEPLTNQAATEIAGWHYEPPYDFYDFAAEPDDLAELLDPTRRGDRYYGAFDESGALVGFFYFAFHDDEVEVGLGLRPDLTGRGLGAEYLDAGLEFAQRRFELTHFRLYVATFNERAIRVYERAGFRRVRTATRHLALGDFEFLELER
jgi:ribosomal-protein-alanine N-acetyltransferase